MVRASDSERAADMPDKLGVEPEPVHEEDDLGPLDREQVLRQLMGSIQTPALALRTDYTVVFASDAFAALIRSPHQTLEGLNLIQIVPRFTESELYPFFEKCLAMGLPQRVEGWFGERYLQFRIVSTPWGLLATAEDRTDRRRFEEALQKSEDRFRNLVNTLQDLVITFNERGIIIFVNASARHFTGTSPDAVVGTHFTRWVHKEDIPEVKSTLPMVPHHRGQLGVRGVGRDFECRIVRVDDSVIWVASRGRPMWDTEGRIIGYNAIIRDITERKRSEEELGQYREHLEELVEERAQELQETNVRLTAEITERIKAQEKQREYTRDLEFISQSALRFVEFSEEENLYAQIAENLRTLLPDSLILVASFDPEYGSLELEVFEGLTAVDPSLEDTLTRCILPAICRLSHGMALQFTRSSLVPFSTGLYEQVLERLSGEQAATLEERFPPANMWSMGFARGETLYGTLSIIPGHSADLENRRLIETFVNQASVAIQRRRAERELKHSLQRVERAMEGTIQAMAMTLKSRDTFTAEHQKRVARLVVAIGLELGLEPDRLVGLEVAATIHDIGKIYVPAEILNKTGPPTEIEFALIKNHTQVGYDILKTVDFPWPVADIVFQHHERIDGTGYPQGLRGDQILLEARIIAVADVIEAMDSHRPYRPALGIDAAIDEILAYKGTKYDAAVVDVCVRLIRDQGFTLD